MAALFKDFSAQLDQTVEYYVSAILAASSGFRISPTQYLSQLSSYYVAHPRHLLPFAPQTTSSSAGCPVSADRLTSLPLTSSPKPLLAEIIHTLILCTILWIIPSLLERQAGPVLREMDDPTAQEVSASDIKKELKTKGMSQVEIDSRRAAYQEENFSDSSDD